MHTAYYLKYIICTYEYPVKYHYSYIVYKNNMTV